MSASGPSGPLVTNVDSDKPVYIQKTSKGSDQTARMCRLI